MTKRAWKSAGVAALLAVSAGGFACSHNQASKEQGTGGAGGYQGTGTAPSGAPLHDPTWTGNVSSGTSGDPNSKSNVDSSVINGQEKSEQFKDPGTSNPGSDSLEPGGKTGMPEPQGTTPSP